MSENRALSRSEAVPTLESLRARRAEILDAAVRNGAYAVRVFGSVARGQATSTSDVDFLVEFEDGRSLFDLGGLVVDLEDLLGCSVDVTTPGALRPRMKDRILADAVEL